MPSAATLSLWDIDTTAAKLDAKVFEVLGPLHFSHDPRSWSKQLKEIFAAVYSLKLEAGTEAIRTAAQAFLGTGRADHLFEVAGDLVDRASVLHTMSAAVDVALTAGDLPRLDPDHLERLQNHVPTFDSGVTVIMSKISRWQRELREWNEVFNALESQETINLLIDSLPATIPDTHITRGRELIDQLVELWKVRKDVVDAADRLWHRGEDPNHLVEGVHAQTNTVLETIRSFSDLVKQVQDLPPLRAPGREFVARQFFEAEKVFTRLSAQHASITQELGRMESVFDRLLTIVVGVAPSASG